MARNKASMILYDEVETKQHFLHFSETNSLVKKMVKLIANNLANVFLTTSFQVFVLYLQTMESTCLNVEKPLMK